jgi:hypothetical protein
VFDSKLQPAYFQSHGLASASSVLKDIFRQALDKEDGSEEASSSSSSSSCVGAAFVLECLEDDERFDRLMGSMKCNNFQVDIPSPLDLLLSNPGEPPLASAFVADTLRPALERTAGLTQLPRVLRSAMFRLGAHLNHDCRKNTETRSLPVRGKLTHGIGVYAGRDVEVGEELTHSYMHAGSGTQEELEALGPGERGRMLAQYLFRCECSLCVEQRKSDLYGGSSDDDDDDDY